MSTLPPDALALLKEAKTSQDFMFDHGDHLTATGERSIAFAQYRFELSDGRDMLINFEDASFTGFSIVEREPEEREEEDPIVEDYVDLDPNR